MHVSKGEFFKAEVFNRFFFSCNNDRFFFFNSYISFCNHFTLSKLYNFLSYISVAVMFMMLWLYLYIISRTSLASVVMIRNGFGSGRKKLNPWAMQVIIFPVFTITAGQNNQLLCKPYCSLWKTMFSKKVWLGNKTVYIHKSKKIKRTQMACRHRLFMQ